MLACHRFLDGCELSLLRGQLNVSQAVSWPVAFPVSILSAAFLQNSQHVNLWLLFISAGGRKEGAALCFPVFCC